MPDNSDQLTVKLTEFLHKSLLLSSIKKRVEAFSGYIKSELPFKKFSDGKLKYKEVQGERLWLKEIRRYKYSQAVEQCKQDLRECKQAERDTGKAKKSVRHRLTFEGCDKSSLPKEVRNKLNRYSQNSLSFLEQFSEVELLGQYQAMHDKIKPLVKEISILQIELHAISKKNIITKIDGYSLIWREKSSYTYSPEISKLIEGYNALRSKEVNEGIAKEYTLQYLYRGKSSREVSTDEREIAANEKFISKRPLRARCARDEEGYDEEGYDREGYDREGYDREGYGHEDYAWGIREYIEANDIFVEDILSIRHEERK